MAIPSFSGSLLGDEQIISYLEELHGMGYDVKKAPGNKYFVFFEDSGIIEFNKVDPDWYVQSSLNGGIRFIRKIVSPEELIKQSREAARCIGKKLNIEVPVKSVRIKQSEPASNISKLVKLLQGDKIIGIFDPYFSTKSLDTLLTLKSLGVNFENEIKCLKTTKSELNAAFVKAFEKETNIQFQVRCTNSKKEHRRFFLLPNNDVVIFGMSLNDLNKNEAAIRESSPEDTEFFNSTWSESKNCIKQFK